MSRKEVYWVRQLCVRFNSGHFWRIFTYVVLVIQYKWSYVMRHIRSVQPNF